MIGYLLLRSDLGELAQLVVYTLALAVHSVIDDLARREHHGDAYHRLGRWLQLAA